MNKPKSLALEIAKFHPITEEDAQNLLDGIDAGKAGSTETNYIIALEARDTVINHLSNMIESRGLSILSVKNRKFMYLVILVDESEVAFKLNSFFRDWENDYFKVEVFSILTQMVGLRHGASRPTHVIDAIKDRSHPKFDEWYEVCVLPTASRGELIGGNYE